MSLSDAHKGYAYQDLFSAYHIIDTLILTNNAIFKIDKKEQGTDKFDDLTICTEEKIIKKQIKYSENKTLTKSDFSTQNYDLALDVLFSSWKESNNGTITEFIICLGWDVNEDDPELNFLRKIDLGDNRSQIISNSFKIILEKIWPENSAPINKWRRLKKKSSLIKRSDFAKFIDNLIIETNLPKASLDFSSPGDLEHRLLNKLKILGVEKYPNNKDSINIALRLIDIVRTSRSFQKEIELNNIISQLGLSNGFGSIEQRIEIDKKLNIVKNTECEKLLKLLRENNKVCMFGAPGAGKSWFTHNFINFLKSENIRVIKHYCYTNIGDSFAKDRITLNTFFANLINQIMEQFNYLFQIKPTKLGADFEELQILLSNVKEETVIIIDGIDHIGRIYGLYAEEMKENDTKILEKITDLILPAFVKILLVSQPIAEFEMLATKKYTQYQIPPWNINDILNLMYRNNVDDTQVSPDCKLSTFLLTKSNGNPLYLTYLFKELNSRNHPKTIYELLNKLPPYSSNLEKYYDYLMENIEEEKLVAQILAGSPFFLTKEELQGMTHQGNYVEKTLLELNSILVYNSLSGGYSIYHESFRRYILQKLQDNNLDVNHIIYSPLIDLLKKLGFYSSQKAYQNLFSLLFESQKYDEILNYCNIKFIEDSLTYGNTINGLKRNFEFLIKSACMLHNFNSVVICTELSNIIFSLDYTFDNSVKNNYYKALSLLYGHKKIKNILVCEGVPQLSCQEGLELCYFCSNNAIIPNWEPYIEMLENEFENIEKLFNSSYENQKYYIRACIDLNTGIEKILDFSSSKEKNEVRHLIINEFRKKNFFSMLLERIKNIQEPKEWNITISNLNKKKAFSDNIIDNLFVSLRNSESFDELTFTNVKTYYTYIGELISAYSQKLELFCKSIENKNWYYNWLIFVFVVNQIIKDKDIDSILDNEILAAYKWLVKDLEPFKGTPRTCDLYKIENIVLKSLIQPLKYIKTESAWSEIFEILSRMSKETTTTFDGFPGGPLTTDKLFDLFLQIQNDTNKNLIHNFYSNLIDKEVIYRHYYILANYCFKYSTMLNKADKNNDSLEFRRGVHYLLSYCSHKDRTFSRLLDSVSETFLIDKTIGLRNIQKLKVLSDAVVEHTDGRGTSRYQLEWFKILANTDINIALSYLTSQLSKFENWWVLEEGVDYILELITSNSSPTIENFLFKTRASRINSEHINAYLRNIKTLLLNNNIFTAKVSVLELISRYKDGIPSDFWGEINKLCSTLNIIMPLKKKKETEHEHISVNIKKERIEPEIKETDITNMSHSEFLRYILNSNLQESDSQQILKYLNSFFDNEIIDILDPIINYIFEDASLSENRKILLSVITRLNVSPQINAHIYTLLFMSHKSGWYERLTETRYFSIAVGFDKDTAEKSFFEYICDRFYTVSYDLSVGDKIIQALGKSNYSKDLVIDAWYSMFKIINYRLPGQVPFEWDEIIENSKNYTIKEQLMRLLLVRLKYGEANRYSWFISSIDKILELEEDKKAFIKAVRYFLQIKDKFIDFALIVLLFTIFKNFTYNELFNYSIIDDIKEISTNNKLANYLIREITLKSKISFYTEYKNLNTNEDKTGCVKYYKSINKQIRYLDKRKIFVDNIISNYNNERGSEVFQNEMRSLVFFDEYRVLVPNVYYYNIFTKYISSEIESFLNQYAGIPECSLIEKEIYNSIIYQFDYNSAIWKSLDIRPNNLALLQNTESQLLIKEIEIDTWITVAHYERFYYKRSSFKGDFSTSNSCLLAVSALGFSDNFEEVPIMGLGDEYNLTSSKTHDKAFFNVLIKLGMLICSDITMLIDPFLSNNTSHYFTLHPLILKYLEITIDTKNGIKGYNKNGEIVLHYSRWQEIITETNNSNFIPRLEGASLKISNTLYNEICNLYGRSGKLFTNKHEID